MSEIPKPFVDAGAFVGTDPTNQVVVVLAGDGSYPALTSWDVAAGDAHYYAPAGTAGGGGTRRHLFDGEVYANSGTRLAPVYSNVRAWASITGKPTTLGGYGITDALPNNTNGTTTGTITSAGFLVTGAAGSARSTTYQTAGVTRWVVGAGTTAESGSNAGSGYRVDAYSDAGSLIGTALLIDRVSTGNITVSRHVIPSSDNAFDNGVSGNAWRNGRFGGTVTATTFVGALTGNASTATSVATLTTPRNINGVAFDGSVNITVTAAAGTLTGTTLNATVVTSSLTSVGTLSALSVADTVTVSKGTNTNWLALNASNTDTGTTARTTFQQTNGTASTNIILYGSGFTSTAISIANGFLLYNNGAGGVTIDADNGSGVIQFASGGQTVRWKIDASGNFLGGADGAYNIGAAASGRPNNVFVAGGVQVSGNVYLMTGASNLYFDAGFAARLYSTGTGHNQDILIGLDGSQNFRPDTDNSYGFGTGAFRWKSLFAVNGTIQTSVKEAKNLLGAQPSDVDIRAAIRNADIAAYTYKGDRGFTRRDGTLGRKHHHFGPMHGSLPVWMQTTDDGLNPMNVAGLALAGLKIHDREITDVRSQISALEAKIAALSSQN